MGRFGPIVDDILTAASSTTIAINANAVVYTMSFKLLRGEYFGLDYRASSSGLIGLKIELEQGSRRPTTEGSADAGYVVPENFADIEGDLDDTTQHHKNLSPIPLPYGRLKITGSGTNDATTTLRARLTKQEE